MRAKCSKIFDMEIYAEYFFLENVIANVIILLITSKLWRVKVKPWKIAAGSVLATLYAFGLFYPNLYFVYHPMLKAVVAGMIVCFTFGYYDKKQLIKLTLTFYLAGILLGGLVSVSMYLLGNQFIISNNAFYLGNITYLKVIMGCLCGYFIVRLLLMVFSEKDMQKRMSAEVIIGLEGREVRLKGIVDTANFLTEPITGRAVFIAEEEAVSSLFQDGLEGLQNRVYMIPYRSLGEDHGMLLGIRVDKVMIKGEGKEAVAADGILGIYKGKLSSDGAYSAIIHPQMLEREALGNG